MKKNALTTAVVAGLTGVAGMVGVANAVNVNPDGLGQVLLFPYYTTRGGNDTLISIVNTTPATKAVKIRFIEALNSREVLDFNLYMSPFDVWTAAITEFSDGTPGMITADTSCTVPYFQGGTPGNIGRQEFLNFQYTGPNADFGPASIERAGSGYIEVITMGTLDPDSDVAAAAKHVNGVPRSGGPFGAPCSLLVSSWASATPSPWGLGFGNDVTPEVDTRPTGPGGLFGSAYIVNSQNGTMLTYRPTAIDGFYSGGGTVAERHTSPGSVLPNLNSATNFTSNVFDNGVVRTSNWNIGSGVDGLLAVNATLTMDKIFNEYVLEAGLGAKTEWVVTFPTKRFHTDNAFGGFTNTAVRPFTNTWWRISGGEIVTIGNACETIGVDFWDREEQKPATGVIVSPPPPTPGFRLCREANVVRFSNAGSVPAATEILGEITWPGFGGRLDFVNLRVEDFESGWVQMDLYQNRAARESLASIEGHRYGGLPVIGFAATTFVRGDTGAGVLANYGGTWLHRGSRRFITGTQS